MKPRIEIIAANPLGDLPITADPPPKQAALMPARIHIMLKTKTTKAFSSEMDSSSSEEPQSPTYMSERSNEGSPRGSMEDALEEPGSSQGYKYAKAYKKVQDRIEHAMRETTKHAEQNPQKVLLYVIKMSATKQSRTPTVNLYGGDLSKNKHQLFEYFKMYLDCSKCQEDGENDVDLRRFRRKVKKKLRLGENFRIYNQQGHPIQDCDLSFINQENRRRGIVYVSQQNLMFDYDVYLRMFKDVRMLGEGGYGQVFLGRHMITSEEYAIKFIQPSIQKADEASKAFKEAQVLQTLKHPSVIKLSNVFQLPDTRIILFMQFIKGGSLRDYIDQQPGRKVLESEAQKIMYEVSSALNYCHQRRIVHRDIKLENIMMREKGSINRGVVIIDFGLAGNLQKMKEYHLEGTIKYAPPELMSGSNLHADPAFDVWTLGVLMYRLVSGIYPFEGQTYPEVKKSILTHTPIFPIENFEFISDSCVALIKLMLNKDSTKRPKLYQLIQHPWFMPHKQYQLISSNPTMTMDNTLMHFFKQELSNTQALRNNSSTCQQDSNQSQGQANMTTSESMAYYLSRRKGLGSKKGLHYGVRAKDFRDRESNSIEKTRQGQMVRGVGFGAQSGTNVLVQEQVGMIHQQPGKVGLTVNANITQGWSQQNEPQSNSKLHKNIQPSSPFKETGLVLDQNPVNRIVGQLGTLEKVPSKLKSNQKRWESNQRRNEHLQALMENHFGLANHARSPDKVLLIQQIQGDDDSLTPRSRFSMSSFQQKQASTKKGKGLNDISETKFQKMKISKPEFPLINNAGAKGRIGQVVEIQTFDIEEGNKSPKRRSNITVNHTSNNSILPDTTRTGADQTPLSSNFKMHPSIAGIQAPIDNYDQILLTRGGGSLSRYGFDAITPQLAAGGQFTTKNQHMLQQKQRKTTNMTQLDDSKMEQMMHSNSSPKVSFGNHKSALKQQNRHTKVAVEKRVVINLV